MSTRLSVSKVSRAAGRSDDRADSRSMGFAIRPARALGLAVGFAASLVGSLAWAVSPNPPLVASPIAAAASGVDGSATASTLGTSVGTSATAAAKPGRVSSAGTLASSQLTLSPPTSTIHWAVNKDGSVELSDRPLAAGGTTVRQGVERYAGSSDAESLARARRERDYWREQSDGFASRQRERDRELELRRQQALARAEHDLYASAYSPYYMVPGLGLYRNRGGFPVPAVPGANNGIPLNGTFPSAAQTAALGGGPSPFLSSGFARDIRR